MSHNFENAIVKAQYSSITTEESDYSYKMYLILILVFEMVGLVMLNLHMEFTNLINKISSLLKQHAAKPHGDALFSHFKNTMKRAYTYEGLIEKDINKRRTF